MFSVMMAWANVYDGFTIRDMKFMITSENPNIVSFMGFVNDPDHPIVIPSTVVIPSIVTDYGGREYTVGSIGARAFLTCSDVTSITIPDGVTSIGPYAFSLCTSLKSVNIPDGVTIIDERAFAECSSLESITIPEGVKTVGEHAFASCTSLKSLAFPSSLTTIGEDALYGLKSLESVTVGKGNANFSSNDGVLFDKAGTTLLLYPQSKPDVQYAIPHGVKSFKMFAFKDTKVKSLILPSTMTSIDIYAFSGCSSLVSISIPASITSIGQGVFDECSSLASITIPSSVTSIGPYAFYGCVSLTSITIPSKVTDIGMGFFKNCTNLKDIYCYADPAATIWPADTGIDDNNYSVKFHVADAAAWAETFSNQPVTFVGDLGHYFVKDSLRYRVLTQGIASASQRRAGVGNTVELAGRETLPAGAVEIPSTVSYDGVDYSVTSIGDNAFTNCSDLTSVIIPSSVTNIEDGAFEGCTSMTDVYCNADPAQLTWNPDAQSFMNDKETKFHVEDASAWASFADENSSVTIVGDLEEITEIKAVTTTTADQTTNGAWYTLTGMLLEGEPTAPGIYVKDGKRIAIR